MCSKDGEESTVGSGLDRDGGLVRDVTYRGQTPEWSPQGCTRTVMELELGAQSWSQGPELTWCYVYNKSEYDPH